MKTLAVDWLVEELIKQKYIKKLPIIELKKASLIEKGFITADDKLSINQIETLYHKHFNIEPKK